MTIVFDNSKAGRSVTPGVIAAQELVSKAVSQADLNEYLSSCIICGDKITGAEGGKITIQNVVDEGRIETVFDIANDSAVETLIPF